MGNHLNNSIGINRYITIFTITYIVLLVVVSIVLKILNIDLQSGISIFIGAVASFFTVHKFVDANQRIPNVHEKRKLIWFSLFLVWLVDIGILAAIITLVGGLSVLISLLNYYFGDVLIGSLTVISLYVALFYINYGWVAKKWYTTLVRQGKIPSER